MIVVDTNIIVYFHLTGEHSQQAESIFTADPHWSAPAVWRSEFRNVLSQYLRRDLLQLDEILMLIQQAEKLLHDNEYEISSSHVMQLVNSSKCSAYDCEFIALAQYLNVPLVTADKKILQEFPSIAKPIDAFIH